MIDLTSAVNSKIRGGDMGDETNERACAAQEAQVEVEKEVKFDVPHRWRTPSMVGVGRVATVDGPRRMSQTATYLDTRHLDLLRARLTLRRRTGGSDAGWHLKTPGTDDDRVEHRLPLGRSAAIVPAPLRAQVADVIGAHALVPVAVLRTRRTRRSLRAADGTVLMLVENDVVEATTYLGGERVHRWREVEVELVDGTGEDLAAVADFLVQRGLTACDEPSKVGRALAEQLAEPRVTKTERNAGEMVLAYISRQVGVLQASDQAVRQDAPDAVHRARVATRRLRSVLRSYRHVLGREVTKPLRKEVAWLTGVLGGPRDAEVMQRRLLGLAETLEPELVVEPVLTRLRDAVQEEHRVAHAALLTALDSPRFVRLLAGLTDLLVTPPLLPKASEPAPSVLPKAVRKASKAVAKQADKMRAAQDPAKREKAIHTLRKRIKSARYAAEAAGMTTGGPDRLVTSWTELQDALGEHQDSVVLRDLILRIADEARRAGEDTSTYEMLAEREHTRAHGVQSRHEALLDSAQQAAEDLADR